MKFKTVASFPKLYSLKKELGTGAFGSVKLGLHRKTKIPCAIKIIKKESLMVHDVYQELNKNELEILEITQHPNITRIFELLEDRRNYYIVMEVITGGNLLGKIT
jgi:calcium-dependent protein kinase